MPTWRIAVELPHAALPIFEDALSGLGFAASSFEASPSPDAIRPAARWVLEILSVEPPDPGAIGAAIESAATAAGIAAPAPEIGELPDRDWVSHTNRLLTPVRAGRYWIYGSHHAAPKPAGAKHLLVDAGQAFGTGRAPSTLGCLLLIDALLKRRRLRNALDLGTGSGVLAMAIATAQPIKVLATDIDPVAAAVAGRNARLNRLRTIRTVAASGFRHPAIRAAGPYDLIVANILAQPLRRLAAPLARNLAPGGFAILSGLLAAEAAGIAALYRQNGLGVVRRLAIQGWSPLLLQAGARR